MSFSSGTYNETYVFTGVFDDKISVPLDQATISVDKFGDTATNMAAQVSGATGAVSSALDRMNQSAGRADAGTAAFNRLQRALEPAAASVRILQRNLDELDTRFSSSKTEQYYDLHSAGVAKLEAARTKLEELRAAIDRTSAASAKPVNYQQVINQTTGVTPPPADTAARAADFKALGDSMDAARARYDQIFRVSKEYEAKLDDIKEKTQAKLLTDKEAAAAQERVTADFAAANQPLRNMESALQASQQQYKALQASLDPLGAALERAKAQLTELNAAIARGGPQQQRYADLLPAATVQVDLLTKQHDKFLETLNKVEPISRNAAQGIRFMSTQWIDVVQQLASGQNPLQVLLQQGGQVAQIAAMTNVGLKEMGQAIGSFITRIGGLSTILGGVVVAGFAALGFAVERSNRQLLEIQSTIRGTHDNYKELADSALAAAKAIATTTTASAPDAREAAKTISTAPNFDGTTLQLEHLLKVANDARVIMGITLPEMARKLADALQDPGKAAQELADRKLFGFNQALASSIDLQAKAGDAAGAFGRYLDQLQQKSANAARDGLTPLQKLFNDLTNNIQTNIDKIVEWGNAAVGALSGTMSRAAQVRQEMKDQGGVGILPQGLLRGQPPAATSAAIQDYGSRISLPPEWQQFANRVALAESSGRQTDVSGQTQVSSRGAVGVMGLLPSTAADVGKNPYDTQQNIEGGIDYIQTLRKMPEFGDNPALVALAYNWGPANAKKFLKGVKDYGLSNIPKESIDYVRKVAGGTPEQLGAIQQSAQAAGGTFGGGASGARTGVDVDKAYKDALSLGGAAKDAQQAAARVTEFGQALEKLRANGVTTGEVFSTLSDKFQQSQDELNHLVNPTLKETEQLQDQAKVARIVTDEQKALTQAGIEQQRALERGETFTDSMLQDRAKAISDLQAAQSLGGQNLNTDAIEKAREAIRNLLTERKNLTDQGPISAQEEGRLNEAMTKAEEKLKNLIDTTRERTRSLQDQNKVDSAVTGSEKALTQVQLEATEAQRQGVYWTDQQFQARLKAVRQLQTTQTISGLGLNSDDARKQSDALTGLIEKQKELADSGQLVGDKAKEITEAIAKQSEATANAIDPTRQQTLEMKDQAKVLGEYGDAQKATAQVFIDVANLARKGIIVTTDELQKRLQAVSDIQTSTFKTSLVPIDQATQAANDLAAAWGVGAQAASKQEIANRALTDATKQYGVGTVEAAKATEILTQKYTEQAVNLERVKAAQESSQIRDQISLIQTESDTIGQNADQRALLIQHIKDEQDLRRLYPDLIDQDIQKLLSERDALAQNSQAMRNQQASLDFVAGQFSSAFDTIGNAIAQAFVQGQGEAVNFGNVMKSVAEQVIQAFLRLAIINPLINGLFGGQGGQSLPTLFSVADAFTGGGFGGGGIAGGGGVAGGGVGGGGGGFGQLLPVAGLAGQATGVTGGGGIFGNLFSPIHTFLGQGLFGTSTAEAAAFGGAPLFGPATLEGVTGTGVSDIGLATNLGISNLGTGGATGLFGGASLGSIAGAGGIGFGVGSLAGNLLQKALGKTGPGPLIGAGVGTLGGLAAGAALGSVVPVIGTIIGAVVGGLLGGAIGPKPPSPYTATYVSIEDGRLVAQPSLSGSQLMPSNVQMAQNQATQFNQGLGSLGLRIAGTFAPPPAGDPAGLGFFGQAKNPAGIAGLNINDVFSNVKFKAATDAGFSPDAIEVLNRALNRSFSSFEELGKVVDKVRIFVDQTVPTFRRMANGSSSLNDALIAVDQQYNPAIATAKELGYAEQELSDQREKAISRVFEAYNKQQTQQLAGFAARYQTATAAISNDPQQMAAAALNNLDIVQQNERQSYDAELVAARDETYRSTQEYADKMAALEKALGAERLQVQAQANSAIVAQEQQHAQQMEQARGTGAQLITSIRDYAHGLQFSQQSPLSPQAMFAQAQRDFNAVSGAAAAGDANSLAQVTSRSDTLLQSARALYGSGQGYANVFKQVTDTLARISEVNPDTLTASVFALETRTQTTALTTALAELKAELAGIRAQLASNSAMPARLAA